jgi:hypothetical protein
VVDGSVEESSVRLVGGRGRVGLPSIEFVVDLTTDPWTENKTSPFNWLNLTSHVFTHLRVACSKVVDSEDDEDGHETGRDNCSDGCKAGNSTNG